MDTLTRALAFDIVLPFISVFFWTATIGLVTGSPSSFWIAIIITWVSSCLLTFVRCNRERNNSAKELKELPFRGVILNVPQTFGFTIINNGTIPVVDDPTAKAGGIELINAFNQILLNSERRDVVFAQPSYRTRPDYTINRGHWAQSLSISTTSVLGDRHVAWLTVRANGTNIDWEIRSRTTAIRGALSLAFITLVVTRMIVEKVDPTWDHTRLLTFFGNPTHIFYWICGFVVTTALYGFSPLGVAFDAVNRALPWLRESLSRALESVQWMGDVFEDSQEAEINASIPATAKMTQKPLETGPKKDLGVDAVTLPPMRRPGRRE